MRSIYQESDPLLVNGELGTRRQPVDDATVHECYVASESVTPPIRHGDALSDVSVGDVLMACEGTLRLRVLAVQGPGTFLLRVLESSGLDGVRSLSSRSHSLLANKPSSDDRFCASNWPRQAQRWMYGSATPINAHTNTSLTFARDLLSRVIPK